MGVYFKSKRLIVLSQDIREKLKRWGYEGPIELENTVVDDRLLADVSNQGRTGMTLLFMSRIERSKGVFDCIDAYQTLKVTIPDLRLIIAGVGSDLARVRELCDQDPMISTPGYLTGIGKTQAFLASDLFLFPSTHGEGMPNVVLEAMALGLPVLTTPCSGIKDFFEPGVMGEYLEGDLVESIVKNVELLNSDKSMLETMASFNRSYARAHFLASKTASRLVGYVESSFKENHA
jgi:glycosyltransferase involved in cell wall biosynthesis